MTIELALGQETNSCQPGQGTLGRKRTDGRSLLGNLRLESVHCNISHFRQRGGASSGRTVQRVVGLEAAQASQAGSWAMCHSSESGNLLIFATPTDTGFPGVWGPWVSLGFGKIKRFILAQAGTHSTIGFSFLDLHFRGNDTKKRLLPPACFAGAGRSTMAKDRESYSTELLQVFLYEGNP